MLAETIRIPDLTQVFEIYFLWKSPKITSLKKAMTLLELFVVRTRLRKILSTFGEVIVPLPNVRQQM